MTTTKPWGLIAKYNTPAEIYHACEKVRDAGYENWDALTPFAVHGLDRAMGVPPSKLPWLVLGGGLTGGIGGMFMQVWTAAFDYPMNIGGKPTWSIPAFIPITFECTVLLSVFACFFGLWFMCKLPRLNHPAFASEVYKRVTDDAFAICIEAVDPKFDLVATKKLLEDSGASEIDELEDK